MGNIMNLGQSKVIEDKTIDECGVCMEKYNQMDREPKLLLCHHGYCLSCLDTLSSQTGYVDCPSCRQRTLLPPDGAKTLQHNFYIDQMLQLKHHSVNQSENDMCAQHKKPVEFFCETCQIVLCSKCLTIGHQTHTFYHEDDLRDSAKRDVDHIRAKSQQAKAAVATKRKSAIELVKKKEIIRAQKAENFEMVDQIFILILKMLMDKQEEIKASLGAQYEEVSTTIDLELENETYKITCLQSLAIYLDESITRQKATAITKIKNNPAIETTLFQLCQRTVNKSGVLNAKDILDHSQKLLLTLKDGIDKFVAATTVVPVRLISRTAPAAVAEQESIIEFILNEKSPYLNVSVTDPQNEAIPCTLLFPTKRCIYRVKYRPKVAGEHTCVVKHFGLPVPDGEFKLTVKSNKSWPGFYRQMIGGTSGLFQKSLSIGVCATANMYNLFVLLGGISVVAALCWQLLFS